MTFSEWYKLTYKDDWHEDYAGLYGFAMDMSDEYEEWCENNNQKPIWNG
jgi:hypothetical protein